MELTEKQKAFMLADHPTFKIFRTRPEYSAGVKRAMAVSDYYFVSSSSSKNPAPPGTNFVFMKGSLDGRRDSLVWEQIGPDIYLNCPVCNRILSLPALHVRERGYIGSCLICPVDHHVFCWLADWNQ